MLMFVVDGCNCEQNKCIEVIEPDNKCVRFIARNHDVRTYDCECSTGATYHIDGVCYQCKKDNNKYIEAYLGVPKG